DVPTGGMTGSRSPSLAAMPRITPPYTMEGMPNSPSLNSLPSLRQPYRMRNDYQKDIQQTPSLGTIPPSVAAALALTDLRPRGVEPPVRWEYGLTSRILYPLVLAPYRVWAVTDDRTMTAISKVDKGIQVVQRLADPVAATPSQGGTVGYFPIADGSVLAVELTLGNVTGG